jgi:hypothetical protein
MSTMNATSKPDNLQNRHVAHIRFRVRCETLGHGEEVFWVQSTDTEMQKVRTITRRTTTPSGQRLCQILYYVVRRSVT